MSWRIFRNECQALTGKKHVSTQQYARTLTNAYHNCVMRHFDARTSNGRAYTQMAKKTILYAGFLQICEANLHQHSNSVNWLNQVGKYVKLYWTGAMITGPAGIITIYNTGRWKAPKIKQNLNFDIMINAFTKAAKIHMMTLQGQYVSTVIPWITAPWFGASFRTTK